MLGKIVAFMIVLSAVTMLFSGNVAETAKSVLDGGQNAVMFCLNTCGSMIFLSGIMGIARKSGLTQSIVKIIKPILKIIIPTASDSEIGVTVTENVVSNLFGLGNSATPAGIRAVKLMFSKNNLDSPDVSVASFVVLNSSSVTLIPSTVLSLRSAYGCVDPFSVIGKIIFIQTVSCAVSLIAVKILFGRKKKYV